MAHTENEKGSLLNIKKKAFTSLFSIIIAMTLVACSDSSGPPQTPDLPDEWTVIKPGGDTLCSRGTEYAYAVRGGSVNKVVIEFMGGGACWDDFTCSVADAIFNAAVNTEQLAQISGRGIYDRENEENPFKDWYHVFIPYCTGDIHWGDNVVEYGAGDDAFTIHHKGSVNSQAVMDWVYENFEKPENIFVTGCSAGAYGSIGWAPYLMDHYRNSQIVQVGDSGSGVITETFFQDSFPNWNALSQAPAFIPGLNPENVDLMSIDLSYFYAEISNYFPAHIVGQYNTKFDNNQTFYFSAMGGAGGAAAWSEQMTAMIASAHDQAENFYSYTTSGEQHCIINSDRFYDVAENGTRLVDWFSDLSQGISVEQRVSCEGDLCNRDTGAPSVLP